MQQVGTADIDKAVEALADGGLVAFPTDTVWGLAADAANHEAVAEIFIAKGRSILKPLAVLVPDAGAAEKLAIFNRPARALARSFWPGPLTLVLMRRPTSGLSGIVSAGLKTVAIRVPDHAEALNLLRAYGKPLAVTSANPAGAASAVTARAVASELGEAVALIIDAGPPPAGGESTVVEMQEDKAVILRAGPVSADDLTAVIDIPVAGEDR